MQRIATETKILSWSVVGEKEKIEFELCDFSPDQIGKLERFVRHPDDQVRVTLEPKDKKLQIEPITSGVRIVSIALRAAGQKLKLAEFHSPDSRAQALKRLSANETPITLTIEPIQGHLFEGPDNNHAATQATQATEATEPERDPQTPSDEWHTELEETFKAKGLKQASATLTLQTDGGFWRCGYAARLGHFTTENPAADAYGHATRALCLENTHAELLQWLDGLEITGKADARRSMEKRRDSMREQLDRWITAGIEDTPTEETA